MVQWCRGAFLPPCPRVRAPLQSLKVHLYVFFNPERVERLAACGITRARTSATSPAAPPQGFVLEGRVPPAQARRTVTHVIEARGHVTITEQRRLPSARPETGRNTTDPRTALELAEECGRLRLDNQRLTAEVSQLRDEIDRLTTRPGNERRALKSGSESDCLDDTVQRFALLELD